MPDATPGRDPEPPTWTPAEAVLPSDDAVSPPADSAAAPGDPAPASAPRRSGAVTALLAIIALAGTTGIGFAAGRATAPAAATSGQPGGNGIQVPVGQGANASFVPGQFGPGGFQGFDRDGLQLAQGSLTGTVTEIADGSITIKLDGGRTVTFTTTSSTTYHTEQAATAADVTTGARVTISTGSGWAGGNGVRTAADITVVAQ